MDFTPHSEKQESALFSETPITVVASGIQWGKTTIGALWLKKLMHTYTDPEDNFVITSPSFPIISQSTLPPFLRLMEGYGTHDKKFNCFRMNGGGTCWFRTGTDPDSVVGIAQVRGILCDEAGKYSLYFWENIQGRSDARAAPIMIVTSPYSLNWLYKEIIRPKTKDPKARPDVTLIQARSLDNPYFNQARYHERKKTMDPRRFNMMYGGAWEKMEGLVYDCFDETENQCDPFQLPQGTRFFGGVDWGYHPDPFCLKVRAVTPSGIHYSVSEVYATNKTIMQIIEICRQKKLVFGIERFYCDPSQPGYIEEFNRNSLPAQKAENAIRLGIDRHYELIKTRRFKMFKGMNPHTIDELETYHYPDPEDLKPDQDSKEQNPVGQNDHALDADRYLSVELFHAANQKHVPHVPQEHKQEDQFARIERLKRKARTGNQSESW